MNRSELFEIWAPSDAIWSAWAKPVVFVTTASLEASENSAEQSVDVGWAPTPSDALIVVDLPGIAAVNTGLALVKKGYRPVPLFNGADGPGAIIAIAEIGGALYRGADVLGEAHLPADAPPAFLLDSRRMETADLAANRFDNRWLTFPQDFPSANLLLSHGINRVILRSENSRGPADDLAHVLLRWQEAGLTIFGAYQDSPMTPLQIEKPRWYRNWLYLALSLFGLRRNSAGGFGSRVPQQASNRGWG